MFNTAYVNNNINKNDNKLNIYRVTRLDGSWEYRAGTPHSIKTMHYDDEQLVEVDIVMRGMTLNEIYKHELPITICV